MENFKKILKEKNAQGLPITTIILIVLAIVVLAAVLLFFFTGFGKPSGTLSTQQMLSNCQSKCSIVASSAPTDAEDAKTIAKNQGFCKNTTVEGVNKTCANYVYCEIESVPCMLSCLDPVDFNVTCS